MHRTILLAAPAVAVAACVAFLAIHALCLVGIAWDAAPADLLMMACICVAASAFLGAVVGLARPRGRATCAAVAGISGMLLMAVPFVHTASRHLRRMGLENAARRAGPVVAAIERFRRDHGCVPDSPGDLVPRYLTGVPGGLPRFEIVAGPEVGRWYPGSGWVLRAAVATTLVKWDFLEYVPGGAIHPDSRGRWIDGLPGWIHTRE
ncbi:MAG: hypothetical protein U1E73_11920 [Planctomycetota bacterium]